MQILKPGISLEDFFGSVSEAHDRLLLLDYDGTLAPFHVDRDRAVPYWGVIEVIESIMQSERCRVVLISGRGIDDIVRLVPLKRQFEIWGSHGWERKMPDGRYLAPQLGDDITASLEEAYRILVDEELSSRCERKPASLAFHWRGLTPDEITRLRNLVYDRWGPIAERSGLLIRDFSGGTELRPPGRDKGYAVKTILSEYHEKPAVAYLGDDRTDEDAFRALESKGLRVLVTDEFHSTAADVWLRPPDELVEFLGMWAEACGGEQ